MLFRLSVAAAIVVNTFAFVAPAVAQPVPEGACLLPDERWCWPSLPTRYGEDCTCETPEGTLTGVTQ